MVQFESEKNAYNTIIVRMNEEVLTETLTAFRVVHYENGISDECPDKKLLVQVLQEDLLNELESLLEYEYNLEKVRIGFDEKKKDCSRFIELRLNHEAKDEFEHEVIVEECFGVQEV